MKIISKRIIVISVLFIVTGLSVSQAYEDGRPEAKFRMDAEDYGIVLYYGDGPKRCDILGARDIWVYESDGTLYMHYDAAGPKGWACSLATSTDTINWKKHGPALKFGKFFRNDSRCVCYGVTYFDGNQWHMFYLGSPNVTPPPDLVPSFPYLTMKAKSKSPSGPWKKQYKVTPFTPQEGTYYSETASPGHIISNDGEYMMFFSASANSSSITLRTLGIARTKDLDGEWTVDPEPIVPLEEQIENSSLYYEETNDTWFLFTNHIGIENGSEYTDAVWVYWSKDLNKWDVKNKAIVLDGKNCNWAVKCIGLPSVLKIGNRLAVFYDSPGNTDIGHMKRNVGLAWLDLPLVLPGKP